MITRFSETYPYEVLRLEKDTKPLVIDGVNVGEYVNYSTYSTHNRKEDTSYLYHVFKMKNGYEITIPQMNVATFEFNWNCDTPTTIEMKGE